MTLEKANELVAMHADLAGNVHRLAAAAAHHVRPTERRTKLRGVEKLNIHSVNAPK